MVKTKASKRSKFQGKDRDSLNETEMDIEGKLPIFLQFLAKNSVKFHVVFNLLMKKVVNYEMRFILYPIR